jgi:hypothetical protein
MGSFKSPLELRPGGIRNFRRTSFPEVKNIDIRIKNQNKVSFSSLTSIQRQVYKLYEKTSMTNFFTTPSINILRFWSQYQSILNNCYEILGVAKVLKLPNAKFLIKL